MSAIAITRYTYHLYSSRQERDAMLLLYDEHNSLIGEVRFVDDLGPIPAATRVGKRQTIYYRRSILPAVVDMLRNEGPVYLWWGGGDDTKLSTEFEPVGEGEGGTRRGVSFGHH